MSNANYQIYPTFCKMIAEWYTIGAMYKKRLETIRNKLVKQKLDAILITDYYNLTYLTGFTGFSPEEREGYLLIIKHASHFLTDGRYLNEKLKTQMGKLTVACHLITREKTVLELLPVLAQTEKCNKIAFEAESVRFDEYQKFGELLKQKLIPVEQFIEDERRVKDSEEISCIQEACNLTTRCLEDIKKVIQVEVDEKEIAYKIEAWIRERGYELAFSPIIVAVDKNAAIPHYDTRLSDRRVKRGSLILIDFGIKYKGYVSDITRVFFAGKPNPEIEDAYNVLLHAQEKTIEKLNTDKDAKSLDSYCRRLLIENNQIDFSHSTGHGVGLEIHESPRLSSRSQDILVDGNVFTVEPGIYIEGKWGMRIEDTVVLQNGKAKVLTKFTKKIEDLLLK